ncbi:MAG: hypothetical protein ABIQ39_03260 [Ilumatobacteraceae bacterium]
MPSLEDELARARALTSTEWTGLDLVERSPAPSPVDVGAIGGFGLALADPPLRASVYVFESWNGGAAAGDWLRDLVDGSQYHAVSAINGALLLFAVSEAPGEAGELALDHLVGKFHGME